MSLLSSASFLAPALALYLSVSTLGAQSHAFLTVRLPDGPERTLTADKLAALPRVNGTATAHGTTFRYEGADLRDVLRAAGLTGVDSLRGPQLRRVVLMVGADGYAAAIALADLDPSIGGRRAILVDREDGAMLPANRGPYRVIIEGDARPTRWVRQVVRLTVVDVR